MERVQQAQVQRVALGPPLTLYHRASLAGEKFRRSSLAALARAGSACGQCMMIGVPAESSEAKAETGRRQTEGAAVVGGRGIVRLLVGASCGASLLDSRWLAGWLAGELTASRLLARLRRRRRSLR